MTLSKWLHLILLAFVLSELSGCSANAPKDSTCERKCGSRPISGGKLRAIPLTNPVAIECSLRLDGSGNIIPTTVGTFEYSFLLFNDYSTTGAATPSTAPSVGAPTPERVPIGGVAFTPSIIGLTSAGAETKGSDTPTDQWCTDSCGIATLTVTPICAKQDMSVGIIVPGITGEPGAVLTNPNPSVKLTITNP